MRSNSVVAVIAFLTHLGMQMSFQALGETASFTPLGNLSSTIPSGVAYGVSGDGRVVVGYSVGAAPLHNAGFRWTAETGMVELPNFAIAYDTNIDGTIVVGNKAIQGSGDVAAKWVQGIGTIELGYLSGGSYSSARAVSGDGASIAGISKAQSSGNRCLGFRTDESGPLAPLAGYFSDLIDTEVDGNASDGSIVVGATPTSQDSQEPCYWTGSGAIASLGLQGFRSGVAYGTSFDGRVIVGTMGANTYSTPFRWTPETGMVIIGDQIGNDFAHCSSADGNLIGGNDEQSGEPDTASIWTAQRGWENLHRLLQNAGVANLAGWFLVRVYDVSDDGQVLVGYGYNPQGRMEGFRAMLPRPEPCPADVNGDRFVDLTDLALLLSVFGATPADAGYSLACDIDENGVVELSDLATVLAAYGNACP